jgi:hypothetical protein
MELTAKKLNIASKEAKVKVKGLFSPHRPLFALNLTTIFLKPIPYSPIR